MCGIFGAVAIQKPFDRKAFEQFSILTDLVNYRGPDDCGYLAYRLDIQREDREHFDVFLGHRRLSIIDLSAAGHQPMCANGCWITFNGEIFNFVELRQELEAKGHYFTTKTDTEVILHLYSEYGEGGFDKLNGMWAFAILDVACNRLIISRDRFSIKPLYFLRLPNRLVFASEVKQLLPLLPKRELNTNTMASFLVQGLVDHTQETFFKDIQRVSPKTNLVIDLDTLKTTQTSYWEYGRYRTNGNDVVEEFTSLLEDSVRIRLRSDVKVGVLLSGGLDSSSISVIADQLAGGNLEMYSVVSEDPKYSETEFIDQLCDARKLKNRKILFRASHIAEAMHDVLHHNDEPFAGFSVLAQFKLFEQVKQNTDATVLLSGQGGDEILLGYIKFFFFYVRQMMRQHAYLAAATQILASLVNGTGIRQLAIGESRRFLPFLNQFRKVIRAEHKFVPLAACSDLRQRQIADIDQYSVPALTHYEDRNSMAHSLEIRHPFLDHRLVDFVVALAPEWKIRNGWSKYVLRLSVPGLPDGIRWRRDKQGFVTPEERWLKHDFKDLIRNSFRDSKLGELGMIDESEFLRYYEKFQNGSRIAYTDISRALVAELWARKYLN